ncbi:MAG: PQQ-binding-like beta-propeller repeat protein [Anaerolineales bacterium]|nr:MAG: PQQ-binding-like beta-propeller repeat protein [Anaerolineales bacterium]
MAGGVEGSVLFDGERGPVGVPDVLVSDGESVVTTDQMGHFVLPHGNRDHPVFLSTPAGYQPVGDFFQHAGEHGSVSFRLAQAPERTVSAHTFIVLADYQWEPDDSMRAVFSHIIDDPAGAQFIVHVGDLFYMMEGAPVGVARRYYETYRSVVAEFDIPIYNLIGNHDLVNGPPVSPEMPEFAEGLYEEVLGPTYYSFDWGEVHYVVLNPFCIIGKTQHLRITDRQLRWLRNDLAHQPDAKPVILFTHSSPIQWENEDALLSVLGGREVLACFVGDWHRDAVFQCPGEPFPTIVTVGPLENMLWLPSGYRVVEVYGREVYHTYRLLHGLAEIHIERPAPGSRVSGVADLLITEHIRSDQRPTPAYSGDGRLWTPLQPEPLPGERTAGCDAAWAKWRARVCVQEDTTLTIRASDSAPPSEWVELPLRAAPSPVVWRRTVSQSGDMLWRSQPAASIGLVILGEDTGVRAFRGTDGHTVWEHREPARWLGTPLMLEDRVIVTSWEGTVLALSLADGRPLWRASQACAIPPSPPALADGCVVVGGMKRDGIWDGSLTCFDLDSGNTRWSYRYDHPYFSTPLHVEGRLWASCGDVVRCLEAASGEEIWSYRPEHFSLYGRMVLARGQLYAPDIDGWTYVLDPETGTLLCRQLLPRGTGFATDGQTIYAACGMRGLRAYNPVSFVEQWQLHRQGTYFAGYPTLRSGDLIVASSDGNVYLVDQLSGRVIWSFQLGNVGGATVADDDQRGYLITGDGELVAFTCPADMSRTHQKENGSGNLQATSAPHLRRR